MTESKVLFRGQEFLFIGSIENGGAIVTLGPFANFENSYAHLMPNGEILRHGQKIGSVDDLEFLTTPEPADD